MINIGVITGSRAEYGLLRPLIKRLKLNSFFDVKIIVTGSHLSPKFGETYREIEADNFKIDKKISILSEECDTSICEAMGLAMKKFGDYFKNEKLEAVIVLGDRYEIFAAVSSAIISSIPVIHIHGGEVTEGAYDEFFRHSITKMSFLHFTSCEVYRQRVIQLGEEPNRVYNVGAIGIENINDLKLLNKNELEKSIDFKLDKAYALVTYHPETLGKDFNIESFVNLMETLSQISDMKFILTKSNADSGGLQFNELMQKFENENIRIFDSLGNLKYLSAMKYCSFVIGNSSSGIMEAPYFKIPTINIGNRQQGRIFANSVIQCDGSKISIQNSIDKARSKIYLESLNNMSLPYGDGNVSTKIISTIEHFFKNNMMNLKKKFYDLPTDIL